MPLSSVSANQVPRGGIILWTGLLANIPGGWHLCDGTDGTPDLRDSFVKGAAAGVDPGATGGAATHTHTDHAALAHAGATVDDHPATATGGPSATTGKTTGSGQVGDGTHTHTLPILTHTGTNPNPHAAQAHVAANNEPAYYTVAYIMKL